MRWLASKVRPTTPRRSSCPTSATSPSACETPPSTFPEASRGGDGAFTGVAPGTTVNSTADSEELVPVKRAFWQVLVCSGKRPSSPSPTRGSDTPATQISTPRTTWAQQREVEAVESFGCFSGPGAAWKKALPWGQSVSATRKVADRQRQRRRGGSRQRPSIESVDMSAETPNSTTSMLRSQSAPPLALLDDSSVVEAQREYFIIPETPTQASPSESDVPRPALFASGLCAPVSPLEEIDSVRAIKEKQSIASRGSGVNRLWPEVPKNIVEQSTYRPGSAPPVFRSPNPELVPSPGKLSPGLLLSPADQKQRPLMKAKLSPGNSTSPSNIPPLPVVPPSACRANNNESRVALPIGSRRASSPFLRVPKRMASPLGVPKRTSSPSCPGMIKKDRSCSPSPADFLKAMVNKDNMDAQDESLEGKAGSPDTEAEQSTTAQDMGSQDCLSNLTLSIPHLATSGSSPTDTECSGSPNLLQRLQKQGLWPPKSDESEAWAWPAVQALAAESKVSKTSLGETPKFGEDKRSKEAQLLLAKMFTGSAPEARRRHGSAPPLGSRVHENAICLDFVSSANATSALRSSPCSNNRVGIVGGNGTAARREATAPPLRPINGSIPDFPAAEKL